MAAAQPPAGAGAAAGAAAAAAAADGKQGSLPQRGSADSLQEKKKRLWRCRTCGRHFWGRDNAEAHFFCLTNERIERLASKENARRPVGKPALQSHGTL